MSPRREADDACGIAQAAAVVGDWWSLLVLREIARGHLRFDGLAEELGVSRKVLTERLRALTDHEVLARRPYQDRPPRHEYVLTERGRALLPVLVALQDWADRWLLGDGTLTGHASDDGAEARRVAALVGEPVPAELRLPGTDGRDHDPVAAGARATVLFAYPATGIPGPPADTTEPWAPGPPAGTTEPPTIPGPPAGTTEPRTISGPPAGTTEPRTISGPPAGTTEPPTIPGPPAGTTEPRTISGPPADTTEPRTILGPPADTTEPRTISGPPADTTEPPVPGSAGCTLENREFRAAYEEFRSAGVAVHGVSTQTPREQAAFARAEDLPFPLLSDARLGLTAALRLPTFRAGQELRVKRLVLVIGPDRRIRHALFPVHDIPAAVRQALALALATAGHPAGR
ncbi:winged helix-turn-helix transcriptional regulator [Streptomyces sp. NPDC001595]|uniref:winged helix-turn-helix transcriptional regulator n=1 Tax=Streptomyces sp. NPDC001532 TaxID=3154520 RepID=UPI0033286378